jgi:hypothetical protein
MPKVVADAISTAVSQLIELIQTDDEEQDPIKSIGISKITNSFDDGTWYVHAILEGEKTHTYKYAIFVDAETGHSETDGS